MIDIQILEKVLLLGEDVPPVVIVVLFITVSFIIFYLAIQKRKNNFRKRLESISDTGRDQVVTDKAISDVEKFQKGEDVSDK